MRERYLLDTCIWRDFYEDRFGFGGMPLGKYATKLFFKILKNKDKILFSKALFWELKKRYGEPEINDMLNLLLLNKTLVRIKITKYEHEEAKKLSFQRDIPFVDCLNAIHARNHQAIMITQDKHFFTKLSDITTPVKPK
ncbi:hypothetical protein ACFL1H_03730 [Nanoarchaeota archaeon]